MIADSASGVISIKYGFRGPTFITVSACASATNALIDAFNYIRLGMMNVCISGGSEAAVTNAGMGGFNALKALSERNDSPETASRPYDKDRDGFVLGEGGGRIRTCKGSRSKNLCRNDRWRNVFRCLSYYCPSP